MSLGQSVAPHLPYLRRYGRSISGSQHNGDALVARLLETLVADPGAIDTGADLRIQLYRLVHDNFGLMTQQAAANDAGALTDIAIADRSEEHTSELQSLMRISYAVFCLKKKKKT